MICWNRLGIAPTQDKRDIKKAYAVALKQCHPEDDPEGFQVLREAYSEALAQISSAPEFEVVGSTEVIEYSESALADLNPLNPVELWMQNLSDLYADFSTRTDLECWQALFNSDLLWQLDAKQQLFFQVFHFAAMHAYLPHSVWQFLDQQFLWTESQLTLAEEFPEDMILFVMDEITMSAWGPSYDVHFPHGLPSDLQADDYFATRSDYLEKVNEGNSEEASQIWPKLNQYQAIDLDILVVQYSLAAQGSVEALNIASTMIEHFPNSIDGYLAKVALVPAEQRSELLKAVLSLAPQNAQALIGLAQLYLDADRPQKSLELVQCVIQNEPFDVSAQILSLQATKAVVLQLSKQADVSFDDALELAKAYYDMKDYQCVVEQLMPWVVAQQSAEAYWLLGQAYEQLDNSAEADSAYTNGQACASEAKPEILKKILLSRGKMSAAQSEYDTAIQELTDALALDQSCHETLHQLADAYRMSGKDQQCIELSDRAIAIHAESWIYFSTRGLALYDVEQYALAVQDFAVVLRYEPGFIRVWIKKAQAETFLKQYENAIASYQEALEYHQDFSAAYRGIVQCYIHLSEYDAALASIERYANCADSEADMVYYYKAELLLRQNRLAEATKLYCEGAKSVKEVILWCGAAECLLSSGLWDEAVYYLDGIARYDEEEPISYLHLTYAYLELQQWGNAQQSLSDYFKHVKEQEIDMMAYFYQGLLQYLYKDYETAVNTLEPLLKKYAIAEMSSIISLSYYELGRYELAIKYAEAACDLAPKNMDMVKRLLGVRKKPTLSFLKRLFGNRVLPQSIQRWPITQPLPHHSFDHCYFPNLV